MDQSINQLVTYSLYESVSQSFTYSLTITNNQLIIIIIIIIIIMVIVNNNNNNNNNQLYLRGDTWQ